ncbi:MAG: DUF2971 domain-containing protein [Beduini sp.]|uniref:DUF2971 domain-containing protein n=1 Tax=Beduini sp. TaxID=1922300 RepID=UPI0039A37600
MSLEADLKKVLKRNVLANKFIKILNSKENNEIKLQKINKFMQEHYNNKKLYRFRVDNDYNLDYLQNDKLWLSNLNELNDIFEGEIFLGKNYNYDLLKKEIIKQFPMFNENELKNEYLDKVIREQFKAMFYIACFTEDLYNFNMWANYANGFKGFCLEYDFNELMLYMNLLNKDSNEFTFYPVVYKNIKEFKSCNCFSDEIFNRLIEKPSEFSFEYEWRLINGVGLEDENNLGKGIIFIKPTSIYIGSKMTKEYKEKVLKVCKKNEIEAYKMVLEKNIKKIDFKKLALE